MDDNGVFVILQDLPVTVKAFCYHDCDMNNFVVINSKLSRDEQREAYEHELQHIQHGDMYDPQYHEYD